jgi:hypothetical protein
MDLPYNSTIDNMASDIILSFWVMFIGILISFELDGDLKK